jgi:thiamine-phosphate pyrophosphorylase
MNQKICLEIKKFAAPPVFFSDRKKILDFDATIKNLPKNSAIIIREYDLNEAERELFARKIIALARPRGIKILIGKDFLLAKKLNADGLHFSDFDKIPTQFLQKKLWPKNFIFSLATHSLKSVLKAQKLAPNWLFISPIFLTTSHPNTKNLGLKNLAKISFKTKNQPYSAINIYALGGVNLENLKSLRKLPINGFGAIDLFK